MDLPNRKLPGLSGYDYSTLGAYFVTICSHEKRCLFGKIVDGEFIGEAQMIYSPIGEIAKDCLLDIVTHYDNIKIDNWIIMPNHLPVIIRVEERMNPLPTIGCVPKPKFLIGIEFQK